MKHFDSPIEENDLDNLLRQLVLDGGNDEFTQNTLTMNADFIFNPDSYRDTNVTPNVAREMALIQKLEQAFIKPRGFGKFWLSGILLVILVSGGFAIYKFNSGKDSRVSQNSNAENNNSTGITTLLDTTSNNQTIANSISVSQNSSTATTIDSIPEIDTTREKTIPLRKEKFITAHSYMPPESDWYSGNYIIDVPGPIFTAKASPENFKTAQGIFNVDTSRSIGGMFKCNQPSFSSSYYTGEPFKSGLSDMRYFNLGDYAIRSQVESGNDNLRKGTTANLWGLPWSVLEYADTNEITVETTSYVFNNQKRSSTSIVLEKLPEKGISLLVQPFYFRKYEVTNKEYREFVNWVRASNGYGNKPIVSLQIDTVPDPDTSKYYYIGPNGIMGMQAFSGEKITINGKRYLLKKTVFPNEDFKEVYNYIFFNQNSDAVKQMGKKSLYIYPDTPSWVHDFSFSYNEPMTNMYFWHPAYDNYPVVGVSWFQAMAFLDWKTHMHQKQLDADNIPYEIEYTLPSDLEWELASTSILLGKNVGFLSYFSATQDWITNLGLSYSGYDDPYQRPNYLKNLFTKDEYFRGDYIADGYFHTGVADLLHEKNTDDKFWNTKHLDPLGISWMDGNVSEWMAESYSENWKPFFLKHLFVLDADTSESTKLAKQIEMLYDKGNAANGKLVRGANWYDERFGGKPGSDRNEAGICPKRFVDPSEQHSTIGFRYVIHVKRK